MPILSAYNKRNYFIGKETSAMYRYYYYYGGLRAV